MSKTNVLKIHANELNIEIFLLKIIVQFIKNLKIILEIVNQTP